MGGARTSRYREGMGILRLEVVHQEDGVQGEGEHTIWSRSERVKEAANSGRA